MAANPQYRTRFTTDNTLLKVAGTVALNAQVDKVVLYAEDEGIQLANEFIKKNPGHTRLDELLQLTKEGKELWQRLTATGRRWSDIEEVWWELSWRLARRARGIVNVFCPARLVADRPLSEFRHKYATGSFANTVFEKVELPELEANPNVTTILYNGHRWEFLPYHMTTAIHRIVVYYNYFCINAIAGS